MRSLLFLLVLGVSFCNGKELGNQSITNFRQNFALIPGEYGIGVTDRDTRVFHAMISESEQVELFVIGYKNRVPVFYNELTNCTYLLLGDSLKKMESFDGAEKKIMFCHDSLSVFYAHHGEQRKRLLIITPEHSRKIINVN
ncbi:MAG: hypothetical protein Q8T08_03820 [Ignavibacteria bacterium]|nr:hypothetical protein [Ignavibacteria bacterium]